MSWFKKIFNSQSTQSSTEETIVKFTKMKQKKKQQQLLMNFKIVTKKRNQRKIVHKEVRAIVGAALANL